MTRRQSPDERKRRDLAKRADSWGENQKSSRQNIPRHRARIQRAYRRAVAIELGQGEVAMPEALMREKWSKWPGPTVGEEVARKLQRRARDQQHPRRSAAARARRAARRRGKSR